MRKGSARKFAKPLGSEVKVAGFPKRNREPNDDRSLGPGSGIPLPPLREARLRFERIVP